MAVPTYYIESQAAHGGYYTGGGKERPGEWHNPAGMFVLKDGGFIYEKKFYALCSGHSPEFDGTSLARNAGSEKRSPGFDLTFSADKSISALWAISSAPEREQIERAVIDATRRALDDTIFKHCATTRVGKAGEDLRVETGDMLASTFLHRTSREADPQLHVHATIFNIVKTHCDGKYRALHGYPLYSWKKAAGATFRNRLAEIMQERLGIAMERHGPEGEFSRVKHMDKDLEQLWSTRRAQIIATVAEHLGEEALSNPAQMAAATLATRSRKPEGGPTTEEDIQRFLVEASEIVDVKELRQRIRSAELPEITHERLAEIQEEIAEIPEKLARTEAVFNLPNIIEKVENALAGIADPASMERWLDVALDNAELVALDYPEPNPDAVAGMAHKQIFTTRATLRAEHSLLQLAGLSVSDRTHSIDPDKVAALFKSLRREGKRFSSEQQDAINYTAADSGRIVLIEGAAGSGKSHVLEPLADLWRAEGYKIHALAVAWSVAVELASDTGAPPSAVHPFLRDVAKGSIKIDPGTVLIVDEAGMLSTRQTLQLARLSEDTGCKLVLVGDTEQQQPIEAGPGMRIVKETVQGVRIDRIRRQLPTLEDYLREIDGLPAEEAITTAASMTREERDAASKRYRALNRERKAAGETPLRIEHPWQLGVSALLRNGAMHQSFLELHKRDRLTLAEGKEDALLRLVAHWSAYRAEHPDHETVVMARTRADVRALNALLRAAHHGANSSPEYNPATDSAIIQVHRFMDKGKPLADDLEVRIGDRLRVGARVRKFGLYNRDVITVTGIEKHDTDDGRTEVRITALTKNNRSIQFAPDDIRNYIGQVAIDYAYAATTTAAQGLTIDAGFLLLDESMARETTYPAATRHKHRLQVVADRLPVAISIAGATPDGDPGYEVSDEEILAYLGRLCGRSQPKLAAIDFLLAANKHKVLSLDELEIGREPIENVDPANDSLKPGTAGIDPLDPSDGIGIVHRRRADRATVDRIVAAARRHTAHSADLSTAATLAADMDAVDRDWAQIDTKPETTAASARRARQTLARHREVLSRVRVFLRRPQSNNDCAAHYPRVSEAGYNSFVRFRRNMRDRWREALKADEAQRASQAERQAAIDRHAGVLDRAWSDLRANAGEDLLALLDDPAHLPILRRSVRFAYNPSIDRPTSQSQRNFISGHLASLSASLSAAWKDLQPADETRAWSPQRAADYRTLRHRTEAYLQALQLLSGTRDRRDPDIGAWRQRLAGAPEFFDTIHQLVTGIHREHEILSDREAAHPGSTLPTRRLADHMATLQEAARLDFMPNLGRQEFRALYRELRQVRKDAGITRTDRPWMPDETLRLRSEWRAVRSSMTADPLTALDDARHPALIQNTAAFVLKNAPARAATTQIQTHIDALHSALDARWQTLQPEASPPPWTVDRLNDYRQLRDRIQAFDRIIQELPATLRPASVDTRSWNARLANAPSIEAATLSVIQTIPHEKQALEARERLLPGSTLSTRRLADHMAALALLADQPEATAEKRAGIHTILDRHHAARANAGATDTDHDWQAADAEVISAEILRVRSTVDRLDHEAGEMPLIYHPETAGILPAIDHLLQSAHISHPDREFLSTLSDIIASETRVRDDIHQTIDRARAHLQDYAAIIQRHSARAAEPSSATEPTGDGLRGAARRLQAAARHRIDAMDPLKVESERRRRIRDSQPLSLYRSDPDFRSWDIRAQQFVATLDAALAAETENHRAHVDRRRFDIVDLRSELSAIRTAGLDPLRPAHRIEVPDAGASGIDDQRFDPARLLPILHRALKPEDERNPEDVAELARWNRAYPKETAISFRQFIDQAADASSEISTARLAAGLPRGLASALSTLSQEIYRREAEVLLRQQTLTQGRGISH